MDSSSSSGTGGALFSMLTGATAPNPQVVASFQFGANGMPSGGQYEYMVSAGSSRQAASRVGGHVIWDPSYSDRNGGGPVFSVAPVRLQVSPKAVQWSVGTNRFIRCACKGYEQIEKIQVVAASDSRAEDRLVQWDWLEVTFHRANGRSDTHWSDCLPKASTARPPRRSVHSKAKRNHIRQQIAEIIPTGGDITAVDVRGVITLKAGDQRNGTTRLEPGELQGRLLVFTKATRRRAAARR